MKKPIKLTIVIIISIILLTISIAVAIIREPYKPGVVGIPRANDISPLDFSCLSNECLEKINKGVNGVAYPFCNKNVQIINTGASRENACDYWKIQFKYFGLEDFVDLSELSIERKRANKEAIVDGFLGINVYIPIHRKAAPVFLKAEEEFNKKYGATRKGSTYFLPSYPKGYTFSFSGSLDRRGIRGNATNIDGYFYEGQYINPSNHFWGVAIDLNSGTNFGNRLKPMQCTVDIPPEIVKIFESVGLRWGGRYISQANLNIFDPMHFEFVPDCVEKGFLDGVFTK